MGPIPSGRYCRTSIDSYNPGVEKFIGLSCRNIPGTQRSVNRTARIELIEGAHRGNAGILVNLHRIPIGIVPMEFHGVRTAPDVRSVINVVHIISGLASTICRSYEGERISSGVGDGSS